MYDDLKSGFEHHFIQPCYIDSATIEENGIFFQETEQLVKFNLAGDCHCKHTNGWEFYENSRHGTEWRHGFYMSSIHYLSREYRAICISYHYGQKHAIELERATSTIQLCQSNRLNVQHHIVDLSPAMSLFDSALTTKGQDVPEGHYEETQMKQTVVPNRNAIFASILYGFALSEAKRTNEEVVLALGVHSGDHAIYPDCRPEFYQALQEAFEVGNWESDLVI